MLWNKIDNLLLNKATGENYTLRITKLSTVWIDDKNVFDNALYLWMVKCMQVYKINPRIIKFIEKATELWNTMLPSQHSNIHLMGSTRIDLKPQGDSS